MSVVEEYLSLSDSEKASFYESMRAGIGKPEGPAGPPPRDPVNRPMIHHLCDALGDTNLVYQDEDFAKRSVYRGIIAPPTSLQVWGMGRVGYGTTPRGMPQAQREGSPDSRARLSSAFSGIVATNCEQIYEKPIRPGDYLSTRGSLDSVTDEKNTALGIGYFTTSRSTYVNQDGEVIGHHLFRMLMYIPGSGRAGQQRPSGVGNGRGDSHGAAPAERRHDFAPEDTLQPEEIDAIRNGEWSEAPLPRTSTLRYSDVSVGGRLPRLILPLFPRRIIATALATRDYEDVHHDREGAQRKGSQDIFMNILTSNGFVGRYVTDWTGPEAVMKSCAIRLGAQNLAYDIMHMSGEVTAKEEIDGEGVVEVLVRGANSLGEHVTGTVRIALS